MLRKFSITPVLNGYIVEIGCQQIVFTDPSSLLDVIREYFKRPEETEELWKEKSLNAKHFFGLNSCSQKPSEGEMTQGGIAPTTNPQFHTN